MRQIKLNILTSNRINSIDSANILDVNKSDDLTAVLVELFPEKKGYWIKNNSQKLNISFNPDSPFGPDPEMLQSSLFKDFDNDLELLIKEYNLKQISVSGLSLNERKEVTGIISSNKENRNDLFLSAFETKKLVEATRDGRFSDEVLFTVFLSPEEIYTYIVSADMSFTALFSSAPELKNLNMEEFIDILSGYPIEENAVIASSPTRYISIKKWNIDRSSNFLFPYPEYNKPIKMKLKEKNTEEPCSNCLVCASVCPASLYPAILFHHLKEENFSEALSMGLNYCSSCRRCSLVCPSSIPLSKTIIKGLNTSSGDSL